MDLQQSTKQKVLGILRDAEAVTTSTWFVDREQVPSNEGLLTWITLYTLRRTFLFLWPSVDDRQRGYRYVYLRAASRDRSAS